MAIKGKCIEKIKKEEEKKRKRNTNCKTKREIQIAKTLFLCIPCFFLSSNPSVM